MPVAIITVHNNASSVPIVPQTVINTKQSAVVLRKSTRKNYVMAAIGGMDVH